MDQAAIPSTRPFGAVETANGDTFSALSDAEPSPLSFDAVSSSASIVSNFDSNPVRKEPHLPAIRATQPNRAVFVYPVA